MSEYFRRILAKIKKYRFEFLCVMPLVCFLFVFTFIPVIRVISMSFQSLSPDSQSGGSGMFFTLEHYRSLLSQSAFRSAFFNTIVIAGSSLVFEVGMGLLLAVIVSKHSSCVRFIRPVFILPMAVPTAVVGVIMGMLFSGSGWINRILADIGFIDAPIYWMSGGWRSLAMVALSDAWKVTPIVMLILLGGIESIDRSLFKAARIDGAGGFYVFRKVLLPLLMPSITAAVIIRGIDAFRIFALPLILMGQSLKVIGTYAYLEYTEFNNIHVSAASSVILLCMILAAVLMYVRLAGRKGLEIA